MENSGPPWARPCRFPHDPQVPAGCHAGSPHRPGLGSKDEPWSSRQGWGEGGPRTWSGLCHPLPDDCGQVTQPPRTVASASVSAGRGPGSVPDTRPCVFACVSLHSGTPARRRPRARTEPAAPHDGVCPPHPPAPQIAFAAPAQLPPLRALRRPGPARSGCGGRVSRVRCCLVRHLGSVCSGPRTLRAPGTRARPRRGRLPGGRPPPFAGPRGLHRRGARSAQTQMRPLFCHRV